MTASSPQPSDPDSGANPWRGLIVLLTLAHVVGTVGYISVMAMAPVIRAELDLNATQIGSFMSAFYFALAISAMPSGMWADRVGVGRALVAAMALMALGAFGFALVVGYPAGVAACFVMGLGYGLVNPATAKGVLEGFSARQRATAMGVKQMGVPIGGLLASGLAAGSEVIPWRWTLIGVGVVTLMVGVAWWMRRGTRPPLPLGGRRGALADIRAVFVNRNMVVINLGGFNFNAAQQSVTTYLTLFLRDAAGASQPFASFCLGAMQVAGASGRVLWALISDRLAGGRRKGVMVAMMAIGAAACALAALVGPMWAAWALVGIAMMAGASILAYAPIIHTICAEAVEPRQAGAAIGSNLLATALGGAVGPLLFGAIVDATGGYASSWWVTGAIVALGVAMVAMGLRENKD